MSILLAFQSAPPAEPDFIIQLISEVEDEAFEYLSLVLDYPTEEDIISSLLSEVEVLEDLVSIGDISNLFDSIDDAELIVNLQSLIELEDFIDFLTIVDSLILEVTSDEEEILSSGKWKKHHQYDDEAKRRAAVNLGRLGGLAGGPARALALSPTQRSKAASHAATKRWK